jgi:1-aminocyclopropane-1-carboxylate deaminase
MNQQIILENSSITLFVKREDLLHPSISGNKFRKLKYNLEEARIQKADTLLTFGGAYSNHIAAVAAAGVEHGFKTIGIIRGEEIVNKVGDNPTLSFAQHCGMKLIFTTRQQYRHKNLEELSVSGTECDKFYIIPEGGTNELAVRGCEEILTPEDSEFDYVCCAVGTGGTIAGIINSSAAHQKILGFPALKGNFLADEISKFAHGNNWELISGYEFGGYAKIDADLITFINAFYKQTNIALDPVYTGKVLFGVMDLIKGDFFPTRSKILVIHTGGLQGIKGMNIKLNSKNLPLIITDV